MNFHCFEEREYDFSEMECDDKLFETSKFYEGKSDDWFGLLR